MGLRQLLAADRRLFDEHGFSAPDSHFALNFMPIYTLIQVGSGESSEALPILIVLGVHVTDLNEAFEDLTQEISILQCLKNWVIMDGHVQVVMEVSLSKIQNMKANYHGSELSPSSLLLFSEGCPHRAGGEYSSFCKFLGLIIVLYLVCR